jgi:hypothetical protein
MNVLLNCICSLFVLPYGLVCALFAAKNLGDPWFTDSVWGSSAPPQLNPRMFLFEMDGVMSEIMGIYPWSKIEGLILLSGAVGAFGSWVLVPGLYYACNYLLLFSGMYFALVVPYSFLTRQSEIAPVMLTFLVICLVTTAIRALFLADDPYDQTPYTSGLMIYTGVLFALSVLQTFLMSQNASKSEASIEKFHQVKNHFMGNGMVWSKKQKFPSGYIDEHSLVV